MFNLKNLFNKAEKRACINCIKCIVKSPHSKDVICIKSPLSETKKDNYCTCFVKKSKKIETWYVDAFKAKFVFPYTFWKTAGGFVDTKIFKFERLVILPIKFEEGYEVGYVPFLRLYNHLDVEGKRKAHEQLKNSLKDLKTRKEKELFLMYYLSNICYGETANILSPWYHNKEKENFEIFANSEYSLGLKKARFAFYLINTEDNAILKKVYADSLTTLRGVEAVEGQTICLTDENSTSNCNCFGLDNAIGAIFIAKDPTENKSLNLEYSLNYERRENAYDRLFVYGPFNKSSLDINMIPLDKNC